MKVDVLIIGGGAGGLGCAMTLASAHTKPWFGERAIAVVDDDGSDLHKAMLFNAPGVPPGTPGPDALDRMRGQVRQYPVARFVHGRVTHLQRTADTWIARIEDGESITSPTIVVATGYKRCAIDGLPAAPIPHPRGGKADRIALAHDGVYHVGDDLHVAGLLAGGSSQFAIAAGIGVQVAVEILSAWAGKRTHIHDVPEASTT